MSAIADRLLMVRISAAARRTFLPNRGKDFAPSTELCRCIARRLKTGDDDRAFAPSELCNRWPFLRPASATFRWLGDDNQPAALFLVQERSILRRPARNER
ncbi:MAG: hypothetical protein M5R42_08835 [Rhodocyclaceae bacterium]|nr:hypothetical protein [Rhodocyclaceae bacterium]